MAKNDLTMTPLRFNSSAAMNALRVYANNEMMKVADKLTDIVMKQIDENGNGSGIMRLDAAKAVKKILHEVTNEHINIDVGIDPKDLGGMTHDFYVRVMVVLHGNLGLGRIHAKPGQATYKKHVSGPSASTAQSDYDIPQFEWPADVAEFIEENSEKLVQSVFEDAVQKINDYVSGDFILNFITVG